MPDESVLTRLYMIRNASVAQVRWLFLDCCYFVCSFLDPRFLESM